MDKRKPSLTTDRYWLLAVNDAYQFRRSRTERHSGKWLVFVPLPMLDKAWEAAKIATLAGQLGPSAKVSTAKVNPNASSTRDGVICVFTEDLQNRQDVLRVAGELRRLGLPEPYLYKLDADVGKYAPHYQNLIQMISHPHGFIRLLGPDDVDAFIRLRRDGFAHAPLSFEQSPEDAIDPELWKERLSGDPAQDFTLGFFLVDGDQEELVGIWGVKRYRAPKRAHRAMMWGVYVSEKARGLGVGRALRQEALRRCREMPGLEHIILTVSHHAQAAIKLYQEVGFEVFGREVGAAKTGEIYMDEVYMRLDLNNQKA